MALDTQDKRAAAGAIGPLPWMFPVGDGTSSVGDRLQELGTFRGDGTAPAPPAVATGGGNPGAIARRRRRRHGY